jgi:hypothetical protein
MNTRFYISSCEYKWNHAHKPMEHIWVRREVGDDLYKTVETNGWEWKLLRSNSTSLPGDMYCRCDIYVELDDSKAATLFRLSFPNAKETIRET